jgi:hypothetical protein
MKINNKKVYIAINFFLCRKLISRVSFIQLKPILDVSVSPAALNTVSSPLAPVPCVF